jgi:hypothetical protein
VFGPPCLRFLLVLAHQKAALIKKAAVGFFILDFCVWPAVFALLACFGSFFFNKKSLGAISVVFG